MTSGRRLAHPRISLIVPTYNRIHTLERVISSFARQRFIHELIIVDDGGTEANAERLRQIVASVPINTRVIRNAARTGAPAARNAGIRAATGDFIMFCDDDIILQDNYDAACLDALLASDAAYVSGRILYLRSGETPEAACSRLRRPPSQAGGNLMLLQSVPLGEGGHVLYTHAVGLWRAEVIRALRYDERLGFGNGYFEEVDPQLRLFQSGGRVIVTDAAFVFHLPWNETSQGGNARPGMIRFVSCCRNGAIVYRELYPLIIQQVRKRRCGRLEKWFAYGAFVLHQLRMQIFRPYFVVSRAWAFNVIKRILGRRPTASERPGA